MFRTIILAILSVLLIVKQFSTYNISKFKLPHRIELKMSEIDKIVHGGFNHCGIIVSDCEKSKKFFIDVLDFVDDSHLHPKTLPFPGAFLRFGAHQIHLMQCLNVDPVVGRPEYAGRDRHLAMTVHNVDVVKKRLEREGIPYSMSSSGRRSLFCRDFDGNGFEFVEDTSLI